MPFNGTRGVAAAKGYGFTAGGGGLPAEGYTGSGFSGPAPAWSSSNYTGLTRFGLPLVEFNGFTWLVWASGGSDPFSIPGFNRSYTPSATTNNTPTSSNIVTTDWDSSRNKTQYSFTGYKDNSSSGWLNIYDNQPYLDSLTNRTNSSSWATILPPETVQYLAVFADFYRSGPSSSSKPGAFGSYNFNNNGLWETNMIASWRGGDGPGILPDGTNGDMFISTQNSANASVYVYMLEPGYTIQTIGFVLIRVKTGTTSLSFT